jgi:hypothetical protein
VCDQGTCTCEAGYTSCSGVCRDLLNDRNNCGRCAAACAGTAASETCVSGICTCQPGFTMCGNSCVDFQQDPNNCGACGHACGLGQNCILGQCQ